MLHVDRLEASGAPKPLGARAVPIAPGFDAIQRGAGGAIVVGARADDRSRLVSFVVAADGAMSTPRDVPLFEGAATQVSRVRLVPLPAGGALLFDVGRTRVAWLDDDGALVKAASLPAAVPPAAPCVDGHPAPAKIPSLTPGELLDFPSRTEGTCLSSELVHAADGSVRWLGSTTDGASSRAELGLVKAASSGLPPTKPPAAPALQALAPGAARRCPTEMVLVGDDLCVDRYEGALLDLGAGHYLSPDYPATPNLMAAALGDWATRRELQGDLLARALPLPSLSQWQRAATLTVAADSRAGVRPSAYVTGSTAKLACEAAGKRLCTHLEWKRACRGQADTMFPYGSAYEDGTCNVNVLVHPAAILHGNASVGHMDPRLNRVAGPRGGSVLHLTGDNPRCASRWGDDAIFDMVGNLDEWVDEKGAPSRAASTPAGPPAAASPSSRRTRRPTSTTRPASAAAKTQRHSGACAGVGRAREPGGNHPHDDRHRTVIVGPARRAVGRAAPSGWASDGNADPARQGGWLCHRSRGLGDDKAEPLA